MIFCHIFVPVVLAFQLYHDLALFIMWHYLTIVVSELGRTIRRIEGNTRSTINHSCHLVD